MLITVTKLLTVAPVASGLMVGNERQCPSGLCLSDLSETFVTVKIFDKGNRGTKCSVTGFC